MSLLKNWVRSLSNIARLLVKKFLLESSLTVQAKHSGHAAKLALAALVVKTKN